MSNPYLTFASANPFTIGVYNAAKNWDGTLYYSTDAEAWEEWDGTTAIASAEHDGGQRIYMRGVGNTIITGDTKGRWNVTGSNVRCIGNVENLLDYEVVAIGEHPAMAAHCYYYMFYQCTDLTEAPELPATSLTLACYASMFSGCTGLTQAPELPAINLATSCCSSMFSGCTGLTQAPELPAINLFTYCYYAMFSGCTGLIKAPELPATELTNHCYYAMFSGCTGLIKAPELPATYLSAYCYASMFSGCTALKLSETKADEYPVQYRIPTSDVGYTSVGALTDMFANTGGTFTGTPEINRTYYGAWTATDKQTTLDPSSMLMGWLAGRAVAGQRLHVKQ